MPIGGPRVLAGDSRHGPNPPGRDRQAVAAALPIRSNLEVVTYNLHAATLPSERTDFTIAVPAGFARNVDASVIGETERAISFLRRFRFDMAIVSVGGSRKTVGWPTTTTRKWRSCVRPRNGRAASSLRRTAPKFGRGGLVELCNIRRISTA